MIVILPLVARPNTGLDGQDDSQDLFNFLKKHQRSVFLLLQFSTTKHVGMVETRIQMTCALTTTFFSCLENDHFRNSDSPKLLNRGPYRIGELAKSTSDH